MIELVIGRQGSGKTLFLVKRGFDAYRQGKTIYSNVDLTFPYKQLDYQDVIDCNLKDAVVLLDEIHQLLPSRNSMSRVSREIVDNFLSMVRKAGLTIIGTTQTERKVDVRFREEKDFLHICSKFGYMNSRWIEILHSQDLDSSVPIMIKVDTQEEFSQAWVQTAFHGNDYYNLYNTKQIIKIKGLSI